MLSERDQRRLEEGRKDAAIKMAKERRRLEEERELAAKAQQDAAQSRKEAGIVDVTGPDGAAVMLHIQRTGVVEGGSFDGGDLLAFLLFLPVIAVLFGFSWVVHKLVYGGGYTVHATVIGSHIVKYREKSKEAAMRRLQLIAVDIERSGVSGLKKQ